MKPEDSQESEDESVEKSIIQKDIGDELSYDELSLDAARALRKQFSTAKIKADDPEIERFFAYELEKIQDRIDENLDAFADALASDLKKKKEESN